MTTLFQQQKNPLHSHVLIIEDSYALNTGPLISMTARVHGTSHAQVIPHTVAKLSNNINYYFLIHQY